MQITRPQGLRPIPKNASKVFEGQIFDVYQWPQKMFDGSTVTFEKLKRPDTVSILPITCQKTILMARQQQPGMSEFISLFGGRVDPGEEPWQAAKRELLEESGYQSSSWELWKAEQLLEKVDWAIFIFIAKDCELVKPQNLDSGEKISIFEVPFSEFVELIFKSNFRDREITMMMLLEKEKLESWNKVAEKLLK